VLYFIFQCQYYSSALEVVQALLPRLMPIVTDQVDVGAGLSEIRHVSDKYLHEKYGFQVYQTIRSRIHDKCFKIALCKSGRG